MEYPEQVKVGVTGADGLLGSCLVNATDEHVRFMALRGNISNSREIKGWEEVKYVVNCAAKTNVDECEQNPSEAMKVNYEGAKNVVDWCMEKGRSTNLIQISSEMALHPTNVYGQSKALADHYIREKMPERSMILYTTNLFGYSPTASKKTFPHWVIEQLEKGKPFPVSADLFCRPTWIGDVVNAIRWSILEKRHGPLVVAGTSYVSKYEHAKMIERCWFPLKKEAYSLIEETHGKWGSAARVSVDIQKEDIPHYFNTTPLGRATEIFVQQIQTKKEIRP